MSRLEHQTTDIMNVMYDSVTNDNFERVSDDTDIVSGAVDNDCDTDNEQMPYDMTMIMITIELIMNKCPMTMTMNKCTMHMIMTMILPQEK